MGGTLCRRFVWVGCYVGHRARISRPYLRGSNCLGGTSTDRRKTLQGLRLFPSLADGMSVAPGQLAITADLQP
jgi:hypothetical protein